MVDSANASKSVSFVRLIGPILGLSGVALAASIGSASEADMSDPKHVLQLQVDESGDTAEIVVIGQSEAPVRVRYTLNVTGSSSTSHAGRTSLSGGASQTLSRVKINKDGGWCAKLDVEQSDGTSYRLTEGDC